MMSLTIVLFQLEARKTWEEQIHYVLMSLDF